MVKQRPNGVTIKRDGIIRQIDNMGVRDELPDFFKGNIKGLEELNGLDNQDGRNNKLYSHKFKIMSVTDYKKVLRFINEHIFAAPLDEDEFLTVIRDEQIKAEKDNEYDIAMTLIKKHNIVEFNSHIYYYNDETTRYETGRLDRLVAENLKGQKINYMNEVEGQIMRYVPVADQTEQGFDIRFKNGIIRNGQWYELMSREFTPFYIDVDYDPDAEQVGAVDDYLEQLTEGDGNYKHLIVEMIAHALITDMEFKKALGRFTVIIGSGGEGKGTLLEIIARILGKQNCSYNSIKQLADERYAYDLVGKLANLGDDIEDAPITNAEMKMLKNISTCDPVMVRQLNKMAYSTKLTASLIFTSNHMLKTHEKGESYKRRVTWCPMFNKPTKVDEKLITKVTTPEALEYWIRLIMEGYERLCVNKKFTVSEKVAEYTAKYHQENNTCEMWVKDKKPDYFIGLRPPEVYEEYEKWADFAEGRGKAQSPRALKKTIEIVHGLVTGSARINGDPATVYKRVEKSG
jgi:putative DNA primase/helicase